jgi:transcriptional regulator with XRE-family HTH domain
VGKGWSLETLANAIGGKTTPKTISRLERGERQLTQLWMEKLGNAASLMCFSPSAGLGVSSSGRACSGGGHLADLPLAPKVFEFALAMWRDAYDGVVSLALFQPSKPTLTIEAKCR